MMIKVAIVEVMLKENNNDYFKVAKIVGKNYSRGIYTEQEYEEYMDILAGKMMFG